MDFLGIGHSRHIRDCYLLTAVWLYVHLFFVYLVYKRVFHTGYIHSGDVECSINIMAEVVAKLLSPSLSLEYLSIEQLRESIPFE